MGLLTHSKKAIKLKGDKSLSERFFRIIKPLKSLVQNLKVILENFLSQLGELIILIQ